VIHFLTQAVERTPVHDGFWRNVLTYREHLDARLRVHLSHYKNLNNPYDSDSNEDAWWADEVLPYAFGKRIPIGDDTVFAADVRVVPTASNPLSGLQLLGRESNVVVPHTRQHLKSYPSAQSDQPKIHYSTGACTLPWYSDTKLGVKAREHHIFGFVIVETRPNGCSFLRNVNARSSDGSFVDSARGLWVHDGVVEYAPPAQAIRIGDSHAHEQCEITIRAVEDIIARCEPERVVMDDVYSHSVAGHRLERDNWVHAMQRERSVDTVKSELIQSWALMERLGCTDVMDSNHHHHLDEWCDNTDARQDHRNLEVWATLLTDKVRDPDMPAYEAAARRWGPWAPGEGPRFWRRGERCVIGKVRHDHGHEGFSGTRGSAGQWHKAGCLMTTAHTHVETIRDGHYCVGHTSDATKHEYTDITKSNWSHSVCVQDHLGKRQIIRIVDGVYAT
jgi:hypothetical protein